MTLLLCFRDKLLDGNMDNDYVALALQRLCQALVCRIAATAVVQDNFSGKKTTTEQQNIEKCGKGVYYSPVPVSSGHRSHSGLCHSLCLLW